VKKPEPDCIAQMYAAAGSPYTPRKRPKPDAIAVLYAKLMAEQEAKGRALPGPSRVLALPASTTTLPVVAQPSAPVVAQAEPERPRIHLPAQKEPKPRKRSIHIQRKGKTTEVVLDLRAMADGILPVIDLE
jgi:hypothetical protein